MDKVLKAAKELKVITSDDKVYGLRKRAQKMDHNLKCLFTAIKEAAANLTLDDNVVWGDNSVVVDKLNSSRRELSEIKDGISADSPLCVIIDAMIAMKENNFSHYTRQIIDSLGIKAKVRDMSAESKAVDERYPMFKHFSYYTEKESAIQYVNDMDELHAYRAICKEAVDPTAE